MIKSARRMVFRSGTRLGGAFKLGEARTDPEGWLCPALLRYFTTAPERLFVKFEPPTLVTRVVSRN